MDLELTDDQQLFRETTRKFLEDTCPLDDGPPDRRRRARRLRPEWWRRGAELGWVSMLVPEEHGGGSVSGNGSADLALVAEEMGRLVSPGPADPHQRGGRGAVPVGHAGPAQALWPAW